MKQTTVYVDELLESCRKCAYSQINLALGVETRICGLQYGFISIDIDKFPNCPLQSIKAHDRELVKEVCEKIRKTIASTVDLAESNQQIKDQFYIILDQMQKEYEK